MNINFKKVVVQTFKNAPSIEKTQELNSYLLKKKILLLKPYPSKNRLNPKYYDTILKLFQFNKSIEHNPKVQSKTNVTEYISKIKNDHKFDEILGVSELDQNETLEFIKENNVAGINFIIDPNNEIKMKNVANERFEMILNNLEVDCNLILKISVYKEDPSVQGLALANITYYLKMLLIFSFFPLSYILIRENKKCNNLYTTLRKMKSF